MAISDDELNARRKRNEEARAELEKANSERIQSEQGKENDRMAADLDSEYTAIQNAIAQARGLNAKAVDNPADKPKEKTAETPVAPLTGAKEK